MKGNFAAYQQMTPAVADFTQMAQRAEEIYGKIKAKEQADAAVVQKKYSDYLKDLADYESDFNEADVDYQFKSEMTRAGNSIRDELYQIHKQKTQMEHFGGVGSKEYEQLTLREQQLNETPEMFKKTFDSYNNLLTEYYAGKGTKYDNQLNGPLELKLLKGMKDNTWRFNEKNLKFEVKDPETGEVQSMSAGQFSTNPLIFGRPKAMVDIPGIAKDMTSEIGVESRSYFDPKSNSQVTIKKSEASGVQKRLVFNHVLGEVNKRPDLVEKLALNNMTPTSYTEDIMTAAGFKSGTYRHEMKKAEPSKAGQGPNWENFPPQTVDSIGVAHYGDGKEYDIKNPAYNAVSFRGTGKVSINPSSVFVMNTSSPLYVSRGETSKLTGVTPEGKKATIASKGSEVIEGRTVTEVSSGIQDFTFQRAQQMNIYQGDAAYRLRFNDEDDKPIQLILRKGKEIPQSILDGSAGKVAIESLGMTKDLPVKYAKAEGEIVQPTLQGETIDNILSNSSRINMAIGEGRIGGSELLVAIPMNEANKAAVSSINSTTQSGAFKNTKGFLLEWQDRYGSDKGSISGPVGADQAVVNEVAEEVTTDSEVVSPSDLVGLTAEEIMEQVDVDEETANKLANKELDEISSIIEQLQNQ